MKQILLAKRYAKAAVGILEKDADRVRPVPTIIEEAKKFLALIKENPEIKKILSSAVFHKDKKIEFIEQIIPTFAGDSDFWKSTLKVLIIKNRGAYIEIFLKELIILLDEKLEQKPITLKLAHEMDPETIAKITTEIEKTLNSKIVYDLQIDKSIIGGFVATTDSQIIDASVRTQLNNFIKV